MTNATSPQPDDRGAPGARRPDAGSLASIRDLLARIMAHADTAALALEQAIRGRATMDAELEAAVETAARRLIAEDAHTIGAGFVASAAFAAGAGRMAWWQARGRGERRAVARLDSAATGAGDFQRDIDSVEWFYEPASTGRPHLTGPYVDYLCTDDLTLTYTAPVRDGGTLLGVVGLDVEAGALESALHEALRGLGGPAVVITSERRVVASTLDEVLAMDRLGAEASAALAWASLGDVPFEVGILAGTQRSSPSAT